MATTFRTTDRLSNEAPLTIACMFVISAALVSAESLNKRPSILENFAAMGMQGLCLFYYCWWQLFLPCEQYACGCRIAASCDELVQRFGGFFFENAYPFILRFYFRRLLYLGWNKHKHFSKWHNVHF